MYAYLRDKRVLVTGACGTVGRELVRQLSEHRQIRELVCVDNNESDLFFLEQQFGSAGNGCFFLADVRDSSKLCRVLRDIDVVFHTAAFKHVTLCERSPFEAVQTNILGVQNLVSACCEHQVERMIFTSSDKAVNPTSVMGTSKLMGERLMTAANSRLRNGGPVFASTRFGNVLGSRGSVIPIFREQIRNGGPVTVTDPKMTRFIMSIREAVRLVIDSARYAKGGEVFVTKMPVTRIQDLAEVMIQELAPAYGHDPEEIEIRLIGSKPGEKMYEELMNHEEVRRALEIEKYFVIKPAYPSLYRTTDYLYPGTLSGTVERPYNSDNESPLSKDELIAFLKENHLLYEDPEQYRHPAERHWPGSTTKKDEVGGEQKIEDPRRSADDLSIGEFTRPGIQSVPA